MSMEIHQTHVPKGGAKGGRTVISVPEIPSPAPNHRKNLVFIDSQKKKPPRFQKLRKQHIVLFSQGGTFELIFDIVPTTESIRPALARTSDETSSGVAQPGVCPGVLCPAVPRHGPPSFATATRRCPAWPGPNAVFRIVEIPALYGPHYLFEYYLIVVATSEMG